MKSSITACPHCSTQFVVDDAQLSQYNGKVRCGHCLNVFNAVDYIVPEAPVVDPAPIAEAPEVAAPSPAEPEASEVSDVTTPVYASEEDNQAYIDKTQSLIENINIHNIEAELEPEVGKSQSDSLASTQEAFVEASLEGKEEPVRAKNEMDLSITPLPETNDYADYDLPQEPNFSDNEIVTEIGDTSTPPEAEEDPELSFLTEKKVTSPWVKLLALIFILVLIGQVVYFMRHTIAQKFPNTKPVLEKACETLGCKINLPKEIQLYSIDDSGIQEDAQYEGVIRLTSTVTNRADFNQAYPNLEVTLTDTKDKPKIRRTFTPKEYLSKDLSPELGLGAGDSVSIDMPLMADDVKVAGFRILLTY